LSEQVLQQQPAPKLESHSRPRLFSRLRERLALPLVFGIVIYATVRHLLQAVTKPLWFDELLTEFVSRVPSFSALMRALKAGVDGQPPLFYEIERVGAALSMNEHIGYRLPAILAFSITFICLYFFVARRSGPIIGLVCASLVLFTPLYTLYADEARPYGMFVACIAFALVCYQRAPAVPWAAGLFVSLSLAVCLHLTALLPVALFLAAELFFTYSSKQFRPFVWSALILPCAFFALSWPVLAAQKANYGEHFVSRPHLMEALRTYGEFFRVDTSLGFALAGLCAAGALAALWHVGPSKDPAEGLEPGPPHEHLLVLGLVAYPLIAFGAAGLMHGGAMPRYVLCAVLGVAIAFRYILDWLQPRSVLVCALFLFLTLGTQEFSFWRTLPASDTLFQPATSLLALVDSVHRDELPVVVADPEQYVSLLHYASPSLRSRMVAVVDPPDAVHYLGTDTLDKNVTALSKLTPLNVYDYPAFVVSNRSFLLFTNGSGFEWVPSRLLHDGDSFQILAWKGNGVLYFVSIKPSEQN